jgi:hypothetical protein
LSSKATEDPPEGAFTGSEADHGGIEANRRLVFRGAALGGEARRRQPVQEPERGHGCRAGQFQRRLHATAERVGDVLLGDHGLDGINPERPLGLDILHEEIHGFLRGIGLEEADPFQIVGLETRILVDHVLLEPAVESRSLHSESKGKRVDRPQAPRARLARVVQQT